MIEKLPGVNLNQLIYHNGAYFILSPKVGSRTIRDDFLSKNSLSIGDEWNFLQYVSKSKLIKISKKETVVFVRRDPLARLHSCWKQKVGIYRDIRVFPYFWQYYPIIRNDMSFFGFMKAVNLLPSWACEKHFRPDRVTIDFQKTRLYIIDIAGLNDHLGLEKNIRSNVTEDIPISDRDRTYYVENLSTKFS